VSDETAALVRLEHQLGRLLVAGVSLSAFCLAIGLTLYIIQPGSAFAGTVLSLGLVVLMATPILRVVVSVVEYVRIRDWFFVLTTLVVLAELGWTLFFAFLSRTPG
jgi:uncharacterized membrane protein